MKSLTKTIQESLHSVNEAKFKGKDILPKSYDADIFGDVIKNVNDIKRGNNYVILDIGMDQWQADMVYKGFMNNTHIFLSGEQFDDLEMQYSKAELADAIKSKQIYDMW